MEKKRKNGGQNPTPELRHLESRVSALDKCDLGEVVQHSELNFLHKFEDGNPWLVSPFSTFTF